MKSIFSICKIFFCSFIVYLFSSCKSYVMCDGIKVPKNVTIYISWYDLSNGNLTLKDVSEKPAETYYACAGQQIRWKVTATGHFKIDTMYDKTARKNANNSIFEKEPRKKFLSKSWKANIKDQNELEATAMIDKSGNSEYNYNIEWTNGSHSHTFDPKIQIKVKGKP